jgi:hypothetical protein
MATSGGFYMATDSPRAIDDPALARIHSVPSGLATPTAVLIMTVPALHPAGCYN